MSNDKAITQMLAGYVFVTSRRYVRSNRTNSIRLD